MKKLQHDQTSGRHIIYVPMPFTEDALKYFVSVMNGWEDDPDTVQDYVDAIIEAKTVDLNPSSGLGEGANIVDTFSFGLMAIAKLWGLPAPDRKELWFHPCRNKLPTEIKSIDVESVDCEVISNENIMYSAMDKSSGEIIDLRELRESAEACPGNKDNLEAYNLQLTTATTEDLGIEILDTDTEFKDSPDTGRPDCLCSRCGNKIMEREMPLRCFTGKERNTEYRFCEKCQADHFGIKYGPRDDDELPF